MESQCVNSERKKRAKGNQRGPYKRTIEKIFQEEAKKPSVPSIHSVRQIVPYPPPSKHENFPLISVSSQGEDGGQSVALAQDKESKSPVARTAITEQNLLTTDRPVFISTETAVPSFRHSPFAGVSSQFSILTMSNDESQNGLDTLFVSMSNSRKKTARLPHI